MRYFYVILALVLTQNTYAQLDYEILNPNKCPGIVDTAIATGDTAYVWFLSDDPGIILSVSDTLIFNFSSSFNEPEITLASPTDTLSFKFGEDAAFCHCQVYIPNIFTPDGDLFNEKFVPVINCGDIQGVSMTICNRMGKVVFDETNYNWVEWNGTYHKTGEPVSQGLYGWQVSFIQEDGESQRHQGYVILAR